MLTPYQWNLFSRAFPKLSRWWNPPLPSGEPSPSTIAPSDKERFEKALAGVFENLVLSASRGKYSISRKQMEISDAAIFVSIMRERGYDALPWIQDIYKPIVLKPDDGVEAANKMVRRVNGLLALFGAGGTVQ